MLEWREVLSIDEGLSLILVCDGSFSFLFGVSIQLYLFSQIQVSFIKVVIRNRLIHDCFQ